MGLLEVEKHHSKGAVGNQPPPSASGTERCNFVFVLFLYEYRDALYVNLTNRCPVACRFCVRQSWDWSYRGQDLKLGRGEPTTRELIAGASERLSASPRLRELVFCGYGEPTMRLDAMNAVGLHVRLARPKLPIRLNTIGLGSLVQGRDIAPELALFLDSVSVSLNTADPAQWEELHRPSPAWRGRGHAAVREFVASCLKAGLKTTVTAVHLPEVDLAAVKNWARGAGAAFRLRPRLEDET
ncbi:MAG: TatD family nuclease-associated radical SAM protein [Elusimicrobia bacterium]|nr:TatD family nuclease-associated radical SAM protein [Elusimicrobiota bacterium]